MRAGLNLSSLRLGCSGTCRQGQEAGVKLLPPVLGLAHTVVRDAEREEIDGVGAAGEMPCSIMKGFLKLGWVFRNSPCPVPPSPDCWIWQK